MRTLLMGALLAGVCFGELDPSLQRAIEDRDKTGGVARQYTYTEYHKNQNFDAKGAVKAHFTDTFEIVFLEGAPYRKHTLHNDQPLPAKEQKVEDQKLADVAKARREHQPSGLLRAHVQLGLLIGQLATTFNVTAAGTEEIDGRMNQIFMAAPKTQDAEGLKQAARAGTAWEVKLWVDSQDAVFTRIEGKVAAPGMREEEGSVVTWQSKKVNGEAWLPERSLFQGKIRYMRTDIPTESEQIYSGYRKFSADGNLVGQ